MTNTLNIYKSRFIYMALACAVLLAPLLYVRMTNAASMTTTFVRFDHLQISTPTTGTVCVTPATTSTDVKTWTVTFPATYTVSGTAANWQTSNISTTNLSWPGSPSAWPNATSATASISGQTVTWTNSAVQTMNSGTMYCYNWTNSAAVSTSSSATNSNAGTVATQDHLAATIDSGTYSTATISNEQIAVSATVAPTFAFSLSANTDALGNLTTGAVGVSPTPRVARVDTNAIHGWQVWAQDSSNGLHSTSASHTIPANTYGGSPTSVTAGTEGYTTGVTQTQVGGTGTITVDPGFVGSSHTGGGLSTVLHNIATSNGTANDAELTLTNNAAISNTTPPATDYTDTITVTAAGLF